MVTRAKALRLCQSQQVRAAKLDATHLLEHHSIFEQSPAQGHDAILELLAQRRKSAMKEKRRRVSADRLRDGVRVQGRDGGSNQRERDRERALRVSLTREVSSYSVALGQQCDNNIGRGRMTHGWSMRFWSLLSSRIGRMRVTQSRCGKNALIIARTPSCLSDASSIASSSCFNAFSRYSFEDMVLSPLCGGK